MEKDVLNKTEQILDDVRNGKTCMTKSFYDELIQIPNLKMYPSGDGCVWTAWDMGSNYERAYSVCRMLCDIAIENYARKSHE